MTLRGTTSLSGEKAAQRFGVGAVGEDRRFDPAGIEAEQSLQDRAKIRVVP
jgi:hypothetical protein